MPLSGMLANVVHLVHVCLAIGADARSAGRSRADHDGHHGTGPPNR
jgi:hypothetical protein